MTINIANPGEAAGALRDALLANIEPIPLLVDSTGPWKTGFKAFAVSPGTLSFFPEDVRVTGGGCWIQDIDIEEDTETGITFLDFPNLVGVIQSIDINYFADLLNLGFPELLAVGNDFEMYSLGSCVEVGIPNLRAVGSYFEFSYMNALETISAPALEYAEYVYISDNMSLTSISFPALETVFTIYMNSNELLSEINIPALREIRNRLGFENLAALTSLTFTALEVLGEINMNWNMGSLTTFSYGNNLRSVTDDQYFNGCALDQESVDHILITLAGLDGTGETTTFSNKEVYLGNANAAPSGAGYAAIQTLIERNTNFEYNIPDIIEFSMTAGVDGDRIGYIRTVTGSVTASEINPWLLSVTQDDVSFEIVIQELNVPSALVMSTVLFINDVEYPGEWSAAEGLSVYNLTDPEAQPGFVNGNTYTIELRRFD